MKTIFDRMTTVAVILACWLFGVTNASADPMAYALLGGQDGGHYFGVLDLTTGAFSSRGDTGILLGELTATADGTLFGHSGQSLYTVNPNNGATSFVGSTSLVGFAGTSNGLFGIGLNLALNTFDLYSVNPGDGQSTLIGNTGLGIPPSVDNIDQGFSTGAPGLFVTIEQGPAGISQFFSIETITGTATLVGNAGINGLTGMVYENGTLYVGRDRFGLSLYTIDPSTAGVSFLANISNAPFQATGIWGLAPIPEPETYAMMLAGLGLLGFTARRRKQKGA